jgi:hypothetical protein
LLTDIETGKRDNSGLPACAGDIDTNSKNGRKEKVYNCLNQYYAAS